MMPPDATFDWERAGASLGSTLDGYASLVVVGADPVATGLVALGIGRSQCGERVVAIGDLFADSPPIQALVPSDDPHGLVDSFEYGVSLNRVAHRVAAAGDLFVLPSGTDYPVYDELLPNPRWRRIVARFRESGGLLLLVVPEHAARVEDLVDATDGAVLVGGAMPPHLTTANVVAIVQAPSTDAARAAAAPIESTEPLGENAPVDSTPSLEAIELEPLQDLEPAEDLGPAEDLEPAQDLEPLDAEKMVVPSVPPSMHTPRRRRRYAPFAGVGVAIVIAAVGLWLAYRPLSDFRLATPRPDTTRGLGAILPAVGGSGHDSAGNSTYVANGAVATLAVVNPQDSAGAAAYAVQLTNANMQAGAILKLQQDGKNLPAETFSPVLVNGRTWFRVLAGAYADSAGADSLLAALGRRHLLVGGERVVRVPYAFLIDTVPEPAAARMVATYVERGEPVYALRQPNGKVWLLAGAFASPEQASLYTQSLRASGTAPVLVYRTGRSY